MKFDRSFKHKNKIVINLLRTIGVCIVFLTSFIMFDLVFDLKIGEHVVFDDSQNQFLSLYHRNRVSTNNGNTKPKPKYLDLFSDLIILANTYNFYNYNLTEVVYTPLFNDKNPTLAKIGNISIRANATNLEKFQLSIKKSELYSESDPIVEKLLYDIATWPILGVEESEAGSQFKLIIKYPQGTQALFKPMRVPREQETLPNIVYFADYDRHNAEIAAFHLDRILGFRRAMPVTGRLLNIQKEIVDVGDANLRATTFISPSNNTCFFGFCTHFCDIFDPICGNPDKLEGSFAAFLPQFDIGERVVWRHPWKRTYQKRKLAAWETNSSYCKEVILTPPYNKGQRLFDLIDMSIFDFIIGNPDRDTYETFKVFGNESFLLHLDNGRGFGKAHFDDMSILAPLIQCCLIRISTLKTLLRLYNGPQQLSALMKISLEKDPIAPILWEPFYAAMDRRLKIILENLRQCNDKEKGPAYTYLSEWDISTESAYAQTNLRKKN